MIDLTGTLCHAFADSFSERRTRKKIIEDMQLVNQYVELKEYESLVDDSKLFLTSFYKASMKKKLNLIFNKVDFSEIKKNKIEDKTILNITTHDFSQITKIIEKIRLLLINCKNKKFPYFDVVTTRNYDGTYHFTEMKPLLNMADLLHSDGLNEDIYINTILTSLPSLAKICGLGFSHLNQPQNIIDYEYDWIAGSGKSVAKSVEKATLHFELKPENYPVYPIFPVSIQESENTSSAFYNAYRQQIHCDFKLASRNQGDDFFYVHSIILHLNGGPILQKMMTLPFKEAQEKSIYFEGYSSPILNDFIQFIYLGGQALLDKYLSSTEKKEADIFKLFEFAYEFEIHSLVNCCTNIICFFATRKHEKDIKKLIKKSDNKHLKQLYAYFKSKQNPA